ncbi:unnamed protein product [Brassicogethes aeneus]|uniref:RCR-type E3 ubiquitin transferase n=1 Tax=Brassicogethes aeneus TaxID=1431903 RepID=A0A9P0AR92_BRAAE|nr:unnamed protein product [Brassicogethes aeneus]
MPTVLSALQRSVHGVLLGKTQRPDWITHGIPVNTKLDSFQVRLPQELQTYSLVLNSLACDGQYLYLFTSKGLFKIGSGYGSTLKGHIYVWKPDFYPNDNGTLVFCSGNLYLKLCGRRGGEFLIVERNNLLISGSVPLHSRDATASVVFSDGEYLGTISPAKDDGFVVRLLNQNTVPASVVSELPLKLARKCVDVFGAASYEEEAGAYTLNIGSEEEVAMICAGKEFGLVKTVNGKVLYCGKASAIGIKQVGIRNGKWNDLLITKTPKINHIAMGHDGLHAVLITEDGSVFFTGTAKRGEDGDQSKVRRQPKPIKPKKIIKVEGQFIVSAACNNGTTALINKEGKLLMFGKDTAHADPNTGFINSLKDEFISQVALGKAHALALTSKGHIFSFGINNKYQCGRDFVNSNKEGSTTNVIAMETCGIQEENEIYEEPEENDKGNNLVEPDENVLEQQKNMCPSGMHLWHDDMCMICTVCRECTGYSISCLSSISSDRNPGEECGCGEGDSGCSICGCCRICAREVVDNSELADLAGMMRLDLIFRDKMLIPPRQRTKLQEQLQTRLEERKNRSRKSPASSSKPSVKKGCSKVPTSPSSTHRSNNSVKKSNMLGVVKEQSSSDVERDTTRVASLSPAKVPLPSDIPVIQIACGLHHSVLLLQNGQVYTFGSNIYGQLGCGDILAKSGLQQVKLPAPTVQIAAGSNHTVILTSKGEVYTFGNYQKGQLCRNSSQFSQDASQPGQSSSSRYINPRTPWYSVPASIPNIGAVYGRRATWVGASGDQTFLKIDESLINSVSIAKSTVTANKHSIVFTPTQEENARNFKCLVINKKDGNCNFFKGKDQMDFFNSIVCMDPIYNVIWAYNSETHELSVFNIIFSELQVKNVVKTSNNKYLTNIKNVSNCMPETENKVNITAVLSPELALPVLNNCYITRFQAAINLLCCLDTLTTAHELKITAVPEDVSDMQLVTGKQYSKEDFQSVNRFESHGGGWGYSGHSIEAIRFMADTDILLGGFGLFGGRGEYTAKIKLMDIGPDGGEQEGDGDLLAETEEVPYECGPRQKYPMLFDEPLQLQAHRWYVAWCRISGPSSDCGSSGQTMVTTEDQVLFYFKSSKKSNNGTDVNAGQIPQLLYKIITPENKSLPRQMDILEPVHMLTKDFSRTVTKECFQSLLSLLQWSWNTFKWGVVEGQSSKNMYTTLELEKLVYISKASLRLIRTYINEIYPNQVNKRLPLENVHLAESIGDVRQLLKQILSDNIPSNLQNKKSSKSKNFAYTMMNSLLDECHGTFVACYHAFYPTSYLKWISLCDLLDDSDKDQRINNQRLLSAVLCALCGPSVRLRSTFPLLGHNVSSDGSFHRGLSPSDNTGLPMMSVSDSHHYPILVEQMSYKSQMESSGNTTNWQWKEILNHLIKIISEPVIKRLHKNKNLPLHSLTKHCCHLLARVVAELVHQCSVAEDDVQGACGRTLHMTPSRFTRTNQSRTWNTGNGSPDAVCFQVDHPGVTIVGVGIYGGIGHYEYEVELLEDQSSVSNSESHAHTHRWSTLESVRGSFGPEDFAPEVIEIKFERSIPIKEHVKYALRLRNHGGRTNNGDGGLNFVKGSDNTTFTFSTCPLSFNGTTLTRGQLPIVLYYSKPIECGRPSTTKLEYQARKSALSIASIIIQNTCKLMVLAREKAEEIPSADILSNSCIVSTLLPLVLAYLSPLASSDSRSSVYILNLIQELLPHVAALNLVNHNTKSSISSSILTYQDLEFKTNTTSNHYTWVQSDHPYKPATVYNFRVKLQDSVKWMSIEFDQLCATVQPEDSLQLYVPSLEHVISKQDLSKIAEIYDEDTSPLPYWPVLRKFSSNILWPTKSVILPGNEVIFSLETASDYLKDDRASSYGFKCLVVGYEWPMDVKQGSMHGLKHLEAELSFLGGMCAASLMKKDLILPLSGDEGDIDIEMAEAVTALTFKKHSSLLSKGLSLNSAPTITQALDGLLPYSVHSNERLFLRDFVNCVAGSSGGRLAQWLQPGSRVDSSKCQVLYSREDLRCGWPAIITIVTRDQYSDLVHVPNMKVDVKATPIDKMELGDDSGRKMRRVSQPDPLTFGGLPPPPLHHPYEPTIKEKMCFHSITVMKPYQNYSFEELRYISPPVKRFSENMLVRPNCDGTYSATWTPASVGCYSIVVNIDGYEMEEIFKVEVVEPPQGMTPPNQNLAKKTSHQPNKLRKFVAKYSAGLRVRAHPSLQSEQIGIVHVNGTIAFIDEIHNDDGVWLRLSADTIRQYCNDAFVEAWCLQYNQHLGKTLLLPVQEPKTVLDQVISDAIMRNTPQITRPKSNCTKYQVIKCGASGHNIRSHPSLKAPPIGMLILGNKIGVKEYIVNSDGCWVLLDQATKDQYCFNTEGDAWSLAMGHNNVLYLGNLIEQLAAGQIPARSPESLHLLKRGFDFSQKPVESSFSFADSSNELSEEPVSTNPFVFGENYRPGSPKFPKRENTDSSGIQKWFKVEESKSDFVGNKDKKYVLEQQGSNGNGSTPPDTPKHKSGGYSPKKSSFSLRRDSSSSEGPWEVPTPSRGSFSSPKKPSEEDPNFRKLTQTGTQTSPENVNNSPIKGHFSIGTLCKEEKVSPKLSRKDRVGGKVRPKRVISPANVHNVPSKASFPSSEVAKEAMSPTVAESLRATFAAFLWHEGIVHDAMACASFLKFHPTLPKQGALVVTRHQEFPVDKRKQALTKEEKARQRHSVEVSNADHYLHIKPSTLEALTRSAANASANRNRKKMPDGVIKEETEQVYQTKSILPPALKSLVILWEELTSQCLQAISQQLIETNSEKQKRNEKNESDNNDARGKNLVLERESRRNRKKKVPSRNYLEDIGLSSYLHQSDGDTPCELCGDFFPHPVTYHMHQAHPGCGIHANGKGYNSGGNYCLGWAGNCGDGGTPGSSWYLMCENCRDKYIKSIRPGKHRKNRALHRRKAEEMKLLSTPGPILEPHLIIKNNAMFLLDLASSADTNIGSQIRNSTSLMPSVSENHSPPDATGPFAPVPPFQCLQALEANLSKDEPSFYEEVLRQQITPTGFNSGLSNYPQRPLSDISDNLNFNKGLRFHRSVSMGTNGIPWCKGGLDGRVIMMRKRNNSSSEIVNDGGTSLLCNPSSALQKLVPKKDTSNDKLAVEPLNLEISPLMERPVLQFLFENHDLESMQLAMKHALRKAMCRVYAMQALNWLLHSVTQPICLHDLLWWFVTSLTPVNIETECEEDNRPLKKVEDLDTYVCEHPLSDLKIAGDSVHPLPSTFHALLQTIADIMVLLPIGSSLQQMAVRCWGLKFEPSDHSFLHRSQVFSNISKILSRSEEMEDCTLSMHESHQHLSQSNNIVESLKDLTSSVDIKASSRQAMVGSLTDNSTETFWESGDEDRNKTKSITIICPQGCHPYIVCVHIDNCRDLGNKVSTIIFYSGANADEVLKIRTMEVETRILGGWFNCLIPNVNDNVIRLEFKGPDNSVRIRQIKILGKLEAETLKVGKQYSALTIQQRNCESETLRVFRLITSQVFGKLLLGEEGAVSSDSGSIINNEFPDGIEENNDLREHMVGILFSRSKLTHLQKQVIVHIVAAIRKETERVHEEWRTMLSSDFSNQSLEISKSSDTYCFEMLSMVLALSGSSVGRFYLSQQSGLLCDVLNLLHTGSARVQRQVTSLLRRMLPEISPETFAKVTGVVYLPPKDFSIISVTSKEASSSSNNRSGILDVFLSIIAKALTLQVKVKSKNGGGSNLKEVSTVTLASSISPRDNLGSQWRLKGYVNRKLAEVIINLIKDMASGKLSESWANITKGAIAENILHLTQLTEEERVPSVCVKTPTLWLALASLCVLDKDHVERLSSGQWSNAEGPSPPRPTCTNHDDGETNAVIQCNTCGNLCPDCDRFLHLHRKTRNHQRQVCKEEEEAIKVELHEGCGRTKLFWLLALADSRTLKALVEYRDGGTRTKAAGISGICRFCGTSGNSGILAIGNICADQECQEFGKYACQKLLSCGHMCGGVLGEKNCLPCLHGCSKESNLKQDSDDMCMICFTEALSCAPAIQLKCGHVFHSHCSKAVLMKRWNGPRITFSFSLCPICKVEMDHDTLEEFLVPVRELYTDVHRKALMRLEYEGLHTVEAIVTSGARFFNDPAAYAMDRYAYYVCYKCNKAYYGGEARCDAEMGENYDPTELVCGACSDVARAQMCPKHGTDFLEYKCRYCCSVAVFFCFGTTHFCNSCHDDFQRVTNMTKDELPICPAGPKARQMEGDECPLHIKHPPTGEEFALGCGICRNAHTF